MRESVPLERDVRSRAEGKTALAWPSPRPPSETAPTTQPPMQAQRLTPATTPSWAHKTQRERPSPSSLHLQDATDPTLRRPSVRQTRPSRPSRPGLPDRLSGLTPSARWSSARSTGRNVSTIAPLRSPVSGGGDQLEPGPRACKDPLPSRPMAASSFRPSWTPGSLFQKATSAVRPSPPVVAPRAMFQRSSRRDVVSPTNASTSDVSSPSTRPPSTRRPSLPRRRSSTENLLERTAPVPRPARRLPALLLPVLSRIWTRRTTLLKRRKLSFGAAFGMAGVPLCAIIALSLGCWSCSTSHRTRRPTGSWTRPTWTVATCG